jgi:hypothetical protein
MNQVNPWLWIGDAADGRDWAKILEHGIGAVWNATQETDGWPAETKARIAYHRANQPDGAAIPFEILDYFAAWQAVQSHHGRAILSQCGAGVSRAATFGTLALMLASGMVGPSGWETCLGRIREVRPQVAPHPALRESVLRWYAERDGICHQFTEGT